MKKYIALPLLFLASSVHATFTSVTTNNIKNQSTVQTGAVLNVSSGTISTLTATTVALSSMTWKGNTAAYVIGFSSFTLGSSSATTAASFIPTGLKRTLTPKTSQSCFEISVVGVLGGSNPTAGTPYATIQRDSTNLGGSIVGLCDIDAVTAPANFIRVPCDPVIWDAPATASAVTYEVYIKADGTRTTTWGLNETYLFIKEWSQCNF